MPAMCEGCKVSIPLTESYCGYRIPTNSRNELQDWISADVKGMFCSKSHAIGAGNDLAYSAKYSHKVGA